MEKEEIYRNLFRPYIKPAEGLKDSLESCKEQGTPTAVAPSSPTINMDFTLDTLNPKKYFRVVKNDSGVKKAKPAPEIYLQAAVELEAPQERCVVLEDSFSGIEAAKRANIQVVALTTTRTTEKLKELKSCNPAFSIKNFSQMKRNSALI